MDAKYIAMIAASVLAVFLLLRVFLQSSPSSGEYHPTTVSTTTTTKRVVVSPSRNDVDVVYANPTVVSPNPYKAQYYF